MFTAVKFMFSPLEPTDTCFDVARISHNQAFGRPEPQSCGLFTLHIPGISHTPGTISLQSVSDPDYYIQSFNQGYLRLARISRNRENEYSFFYNESKYNDYYFLSPEQWPYMIFGRENDNLEGRIRYLRPFGKQNNLLNTIFSFESKLHIKILCHVFFCCPIAKFLCYQNIISDEYISPNGSTHKLLISY